MKAKTIKKVLRKKIDEWLDEDESGGMLIDLTDRKGIACYVNSWKPWGDECEFTNQIRRGENVGKGD